MLRQFLSVALLLGALSSASFALKDGGKFMEIQSPKGGIGPELRTNIALVGADNPLTTIHPDQLNNVHVDPSKLFDTVSEEYRKTDIEEDPEDRFVTTRSGKPRVQLVDEEEENWADESPLTPNMSSRVLVRKKRCGDRDDDDGNANRARRTRRSRRTRTNRVSRRRRRRANKATRKKARRAARTKTTTITRTILPANQVATYPVGQNAGAQVYVKHQPGQVIQTVQPGVVQTFGTIQQPGGHVQVMTQQPQVQIQGQGLAAVQPMAASGAVAAVAAA